MSESNDIASNESNSTPLTQLAQIGILVHDLDEAMRTYNDKYGIGPWEVYTVDPSTTTDMITEGVAREYGVRIAMAQLGNVEFELIQPLDDHSRHARMLRENGEGIEHLSFFTDDSFEDVRTHYADRGLVATTAGTFGQQRYEILPTFDDLKFELEIQDWTPSTPPIPPERTYPPTAA